MNRLFPLPCRRRIVHLLAAALMLIVLLPAKATAQTDEAWVEFNSTSNTLTFKYGVKPANFDSDVTAYTLNTDTNEPGWKTNAASVVTAKFEQAFANARPTSCAKWFQDMKKLTAIEGLEYLNTSEVTYMGDMFNGCNALTSLDLSHFNTAKVESMVYMFRDCKSLTSLDLSAFNTEKVVDMTCMFFNCEKLKSLNVGSFATGSVENMEGMFFGCKSLISLDLSNFRTDRVRNMSNMFASCESLISLDVSNFETYNVEKMSHMFGCKSLTYLNLSNFSTGNVKDMSGMFDGCTKLSAIYANDFDTSSLENSENMFGGCVALQGAEPFDDSKVEASMATTSGYFTALPAPVAWVQYDSGTQTLLFRYGPKPATFASGISAYELNTGSNKPAWNTNASSITSVVFEPAFVSARPTTCYRWFDGLENMTSIEGLEYLHTDSVTNMCQMFNNCEVLKSLDLSSFSTEKVTTMMSMFGNCQALTSLDVSSFNTKNVTTMERMFNYCLLLENLNLQNFNTENVTTMANMFNHCEVLKALDLSSFSTKNVTNMNSMFEYCVALETVNLSSFNTENVTTMGGMFFLCSALTSLDLSSFNTKQVYNFGNMFYACSKLTTIYVSDNFVTTAVNVNLSSDMFEACSSLQGAVSFNSRKYDPTMANYKTGYFKTYYSIGDEKHELYGETLSVADLQLEDGKDFVAHAPFTATKASWSRMMTNKWGTLCLPFAFSADDNESCAFYDLKDVQTDRLVLTKLTGTVEAGHPVLVYRLDASTAALSAANVSVVKTPTDGTTADDVQLVGTFAEADVPEDSYIISKDKFWLVENVTAAAKGGAKGVKVKGLRAWLKPTTNAVAASLSLYAEDLTGVSALKVLTDEASEIYDLNGRRLPALQKGVNIVKVGKVAKKVIVN